MCEQSKQAGENKRAEALCKSARSGQSTLDSSLHECTDEIQHVPNHKNESREGTSRYTAFNSEHEFPIMNMR